MVPKVCKEKGPNPLSLMAIFHPLLKIKRKKTLLHNFTVLIPTHLQTPLTLKAKATGSSESHSTELGQGPQYCSVPPRKGTVWVGI